LTGTFARVAAACQLNLGVESWRLTPCQAISYDRLLNEVLARIRHEAGPGLPRRNQMVSGAGLGPPRRVLHLMVQPIY